MSDPVIELLELSKTLGGPDHTNTPLYKESKYGIRKQKVNFYQSLISDPVFSDMVNWMKENIDKKCILKSNDILNYTNLSYSHNKFMDFSNIDKFMENSKNFKKDLYFKSIQDLKLEVEETESLINIEKNQHESLENEENILENILKDLEEELNSTERSIQNINRELDDSSLIYSTAKNDFDEKIRQYLLKLSESKNIPNSNMNENSDVFDHNLFNFYQFFTELFSYDMESNIAAISKFTDDLLSKLKDFMMRNCPASLASNRGITVEEAYSKIKYIFKNITNNVELEKIINMFSNDYSQLHLDIEAINLNNHVFQNSRKFISQFENLSKETYFNVIENNNLTDIATSIRLLKEEVKQAYLEKRLSYKKLHEDYFNQTCYSDCVSWLATQLQPLMNSMTTNMDRIYSFLFSIHIISYLAQHNRNNSDIFIKDVTFLSSVPSQFVPTGSLFDSAYNGSYEYFKLTSLIEIISSFCELKDDEKHSPLSHQDTILYRLSQIINNNYRGGLALKNYQKKITDQISDIEEVLSTLLFEATGENLENPSIISFIPKDLMTNKSAIDNKIELIQSKFEEFLSDYEWKKKLYHQDEARKIQIVKMSNKIPDSYTNSLS